MKLILNRRRTPAIGKLRPALSTWRNLLTVLFATNVLALAMTAIAADNYSPPVDRTHPDQVYWGDTHVHTNLSADAVFRLGPDAAYRFARGQEVTSSTGQPVRLRRPLDFIVVADHGNNMGAQITRERVKREPDFAKSKIGRLWNLAQQALLDTPGVDTERLLKGSLHPGNRRDLAVRHPGFRRSIWEHTIELAERHNTPGRFTTFLGYEWTSSLSAMHRVVVFRDGADRVQRVLPFTSWDSPVPRELWRYLEKYEQDTGGSVIAIPHNSNLTFGQMFGLPDPEDPEEHKPFTRDYAELRMRWEPIVEATQIKGDSETHPYLSPDDEFADFETWNGWGGRVNGGKIWTGNNVRIRPNELIAGEYVRSAFKRGLGLLASTGANPFKFGLIGSSDSHTALSAVAEDNFFGGTRASEPSAGRMLGAFGIINWEISAAGLAAVWARENTREAIFDAMRRKEVYATTGPRMRVRFFGGWDFRADDATASDLANVGYSKGVPMGGDLVAPPGGKSPSFLIQAVKDPDGAHLDRIQVIKGWRDGAGELHEKVFNVAVSDGRRISRGGSVRPVGNTVDIDDASYRNSIGDPELVTVWTDPQFDESQHAFYYVRVLEIPTPRWTAYDAKFYGLTNLPENIPMVTQERAYTSPIWYTADYRSGG